MNLSEYPGYNDYRSIRDNIINAQDYLTKTKLYKKSAISKKRFDQVLNYMFTTNRLVKTKDHKLIWIRADSPKLKRLISEGVSFV